MASLLRAPPGAGSYRSSGGVGCSGVVAMACTNQRCGWPGYRWGRGPDWATTGVIRPVTEVAGRVGVAVHELPTGGAHPHPLTELEVGVVAAAAVVGLGGGEPAIHHHQPPARPATVRSGAVAGGLFVDMWERGRPDRPGSRSWPGDAAIVVTDGWAAGRHVQRRVEPRRRGRVARRPRHAG